MRPPLRFRLVVLSAWSLASLSAVGGCAGKNTCCCTDDDCCTADETQAGKSKPTDKLDPPPASHTHTLNTECAYYLDSPAQGRPPDGTWPSGLSVTLVNAAGSYSLVRSADGVQAYVASSALTPK